MSSLHPIPVVSAIPRATRWLALAAGLAAAGCAAPGGHRPVVPGLEGPTLSMAVGQCAPPPEPVTPPPVSPFTWANPRPQGDDLLGVWGSGKGDAWAVGDRGRVLRRDGGGWRVADPGPREYLAGVWGSGPNDVFATGYNGRVLHFDGRRWSLHPTGVSNDFNGIWGSGPKDVFTVGDRGVVFHYDGTCWRRQATGTDNLFFGVWGSGPDDVWAVGGRANAAHYDGAAWHTVDVGPAGAGGHFVGVWGTGAGIAADLYVVGSEGLVLRRHGGVWGREDAGTDALLRWVWGSGPDDVWVAGDGGTVRRFDGVTWRPVELGTTRAVRGAWRAPDGDTLLVGDDGLLMEGREGVFRSRREGPSMDLFAIAGDWAGGEDGALLYRTADGRWFARKVPTDRPIAALAMLADGRVLAAAGPGLWLGDATGWHLLPRPSGAPEGAVHAIRTWGKGAVAVGDGGLVLTWDGRAWGRLDAPTDRDLYGVAGDSPEDFWAVGAGGTALRREGGAWADRSVADGEDLYGVSDSGVAVGSMGGIRRFEGGAWRTLAEPEALALYAVVDAPDGAAWAAGDFGTVRKVEGDRVTPVPVPTGQTLWAVGVGPGGRVTLVGEGGTILEGPAAFRGVKIK